MPPAEKRARDACWVRADDDAEYEYDEWPKALSAEKDAEPVEACIDGSSATADGDSGGGGHAVGRQRQWQRW